MVNGGFLYGFLDDWLMIIGGIHTLLLVGGLEDFWISSTQVTVTHFSEE